MQNHIKSGSVFEHTLTVAVSAGDVVVSGSAVGIAAVDGAIGDKINVNRCGVWVLTKKAPLVITQGDLLYWDATPGEITKTAADGVFIGHADSDAGSAAVEVNVFLVPNTPDVAANPAADITPAYASPILTAHTPLSTSDTYTDAAVNAELLTLEVEIQALKTAMDSLNTDLTGLRANMVTAGLVV